jgi:hypothetical protein
MLREILIEYRSRLVDPDPTALVFTTASGGPRDKDNVPCVMDQVGHVDEGTTLRIYAKVLTATADTSAPPSTR